MKMITFIDVLNVEREIKTCIDLKSQLNGEPCWEVLIRATKRDGLVTGNTGWHTLPAFEGRKFATEEDAYQAMVVFVNSLVEKAQKIGRHVSVSW